MRMKKIVNNPYVLISLIVVCVSIIGSSIYDRYQRNNPQPPIKVYKTVSPIAAEKAVANGETAESVNPMTTTQPLTEVDETPQEVEVPETETLETEPLTDAERQPQEVEVPETEILLEVPETESESTKQSTADDSEAKLYEMLSQRAISSTGPGTVYIIRSRQDLQDVIAILEAQKQNEPQHRHAMIDHNISILRSSINGPRLGRQP